MSTKTPIVDENLVEHLTVQDKPVPVRRYWLTDHWEFRFAYRDPATRPRRFKCTGTIEGVKEAARQLQEQVLSPAQAQHVAIGEIVTPCIVSWRQRKRRRQNDPLKHADMAVCAPS